MVKSPAVLEKDPGLTSSTLGTAHNCNSSTRQVGGTDTYAGKTLMHMRDRMKQGAKEHWAEEGRAAVWAQQMKARATELPVFSIGTVQ